MKTKIQLVSFQFATALAVSAFAGCVSIKQDKPLEVHVRVDIYEHAAETVDELTTPLPPKGKPHSALEGETRVIYVANVGGAERSREEVVNSIRARAEEVRAQKSAGALGEDSHGYLAVVKAGKGKNAEAVASAENTDRKALYQLDAAKAGTSLASQEQAYAQAFRKKAQAGDWLEQDGKWVQK